MEISDMTKNVVNEDGFGDEAFRAEKEHEVQLARIELFKIAQDSINIHKALKTIPEMQGLEGWVAAKIALAANYLSDVMAYIEYEKIGQGPAATPGHIPSKLGMPAQVNPPQIPVMGESKNSKKKPTWDQAVAGSKMASGVEDKDPPKKVKEGTAGALIGGALGGAVGARSGVGVSKGASTGAEMGSEIEDLAKDAYGKAKNAVSKVGSYFKGKKKAQTDSEEIKEAIKSAKKKVAKKKGDAVKAKKFANKKGFQGTVNDFDKEQLEADLAGLHRISAKSPMHAKVYANAQKHYKLKTGKDWKPKAVKENFSGAIATVAMPIGHKKRVKEASKPAPAKTAADVIKFISLEMQEEYFHDKNNVSFFKKWIAANAKYVDPAGGYITVETSRGMIDGIELESGWYDPSFMRSYKPAVVKKNGFTIYAYDESMVIAW
jgi:hypothetical protein